MKTTYVKCKVLPGLFETEYYVLVGESSSAYVIREDVKVSGNPKHFAEVDGQVFAYVIEEDKNRSLVEVAGQSVVGGLRTWVPNEMLQPA